MNKIVYLTLSLLVLQTNFSYSQDRDLAIKQAASLLEQETPEKRVVLANIFKHTMDTKTQDVIKRELFSRHKLVFWHLLQPLVTSEKLTGHTAGIVSVAFDRISSQAFTGSVDGSIRVWDIATKNCSRVLSHHSCAVNWLSCSPDNKLLSRSEDLMLLEWDLKAGVCDRLDDKIAEAQMPGGHLIKHSVVSPCGSLRALVNKNKDNTVVVYKTCQASKTEKKVCEFCCAEPVISVSFSHDSAQVWAYAEDYKTTIYTLKSDKTKTLDWHIYMNEITAFSDCGQYLLLGGWDFDARLATIKHITDELNLEQITLILDLWDRFLENDVTYLDKQSVSYKLFTKLRPELQEIITRNYNLKSFDVKPVA